MVRNPYEQASTAEARTHPEVVHPAMTTVSTPQAVSVAANAVPKKALALGYTFKHPTIDAALAAIFPPTGT